MQKAVVITGAGSGIGEASAIEFSENNYHVILLGRRLEKLKSVAQKLKNPNTVFSCDLTRPEQVKNTAKQIFEIPDIRIECLINNAGTYTSTSFAESTESIWSEQFESNLFGTVRITRELWPYFVSQKKGAIVNVSSTLGLRTVENVSPYAAAKAAMVSLTESLALEGGSHNIRVNCICPGLVDTPIHSFHDLPLQEKSQALQKLKGMQPLGRIGTSHEIAKSIYFLASDVSNWTTGATLSVDGGINIK